MINFKIQQVKHVFGNGLEDLFQIDKCDQFLDYSRHPFENLPFCMEEINKGEKLLLLLQELSKRNAMSIMDGSNIKYGSYR